MPKSKKLKDPGIKTHDLRVKLNEMRLQDKFCDVTIHVGAVREFRAHRAVLSATSYYFETMFTGGFKEGTAKEINISGNADSFELMLEYIYTGELHLSVENAKPDLVCGFLDMACYMQMSDAIEECTKFVNYIYNRSNDPHHYLYHHRPTQDFSDSESILYVDEDDEKPIFVPVADAFYFLLFAKLREHELALLASLSEQYLKENLEELKTCDEILENASLEFMEQFLSDEYLATAEKEEEVFYFVVNWLKFEWKSRQNHAYYLLQKVRLGLVDSSIREEGFDDDIRAIPECRNLLDRVEKIEESRVEHQHPDLFTTRSTVTMAISGHASWCLPNIQECNNTSFEYFDVDTQDWKEMDGFLQLPKDLENHSLCYTDHLFLAGGTERQERESVDQSSRLLFNCSTCGLRGDYCICDYFDIPQQCFFWFDEKSDIWNELPPMQNARTHFPLVNLGRRLYAIGGVHRQSDLISVEYYDTGIGQESGRWECAAPLRPTPGRPYSSISAVAFNDVILAYGFDGTCNMLNIYYPECSNHLKSSKCHECQQQESNDEDDVEDDDDDDDDDFRCNTWNRVWISRVHFGDRSYPMVLFVHDGVCYRIIQIPWVVEARKCWYRRPVVNILHVQQYVYSNKKKIAIGDAVNQDCIPYNLVGAFRIRDRVFATKYTSVFDTGIRIAEDQTTCVDLDKIEEAFERTRGVSTSIATFPFDKRYLLDANA